MRPGEQPWSISPEFGSSGQHNLRGHLGLRLFHPVQHGSSAHWSVSSGQSWVGVRQGSGNCSVSTIGVHGASSGSPTFLPKCEAIYCSFSGGHSFSQHGRRGELLRTHRRESRGWGSGAFPAGAGASVRQRGGTGRLRASSPEISDRPRKVVQRRGQLPNCDGFARLLSIGLNTVCSS